MKIFCINDVEGNNQGVIVTSNEDEEETLIANGYDSSTCDVCEPTVISIPLVRDSDIEDLPSELSDEELEDWLKESVEIGTLSIRKLLECKDDDFSYILRNKALDDDYLEDYSDYGDDTDYDEDDEDSYSDDSDY